VTDSDRESPADGPEVELNGGFEIRIVAGGPADAETSAAIAAAVARVLGARDRGRTVRPSAWAQAGRIEASDGRTLRSRDQFLAARGATVRLSSAPEDPER